MISPTPTLSHASKLVTVVVHGLLNMRRLQITAKVFSDIYSVGIDTGCEDCAVEVADTINLMTLEASDVERDGFVLTATTAGTFVIATATTKDTV